MAQNWWVAAIAMVSATGAEAAYLDPPNPEVFIRAEDQERARLASQPCTEADVGHGCEKTDGRMWRKGPCTEVVGIVLQSRPVDQCFKMKPPERYRGVWIDAFEGSQFISEGSAAVEFPLDEPNRAVWKEKFERAQAASIWLDVSRINAPPPDYSQGKPRKFFVEFVGRKTMYAGSYGHMGLSGNEIIVDELISTRPVD